MKPLCIFLSPFSKSFGLYLSFLLIFPWFTAIFFSYRLFVWPFAFCCDNKVTVVLLYLQGWKNGQSIMSCPTLRHFREAWLQTTEGFQSVQRWAEEVKTFLLHKSLWLPAGLSTKQLQCLVMLEAGWWYLTQVSPLWENFHWLRSCVRGKSLWSWTHHTLTQQESSYWTFSVALWSCLTLSMLASNENVKK